MPHNMLSFLAPQTVAGTEAVISAAHNTLRFGLLRNRDHPHVAIALKYGDSTTQDREPVSTLDDKSPGIDCR